MTTENPASNERYWLCPLYSFKCDSESADLAESIQIIKIPGKFVEHLAQNYSDLLKTIPSEAEWVVSLPYIENTNRANDLLVDLITALRLHQKGRVVAGLLTSAKFQNSEWSSIGGTTSWTPVSSLDFFQEDPIYKLHHTDVLEVNKLLQNIRQWREAGLLNIVDITLKRFHSAYHGEIEDRIIDQMIAFESLFIRESQELTYKLALRMAFLLGRTKPKRDEIFRNMKKAYNYRSRIVHGDNPPTKEELRVIVPNTGDYLRQSIQKFLFLLSRGVSLNEIRNKLDENILSNGTLLV